MPSRSWAAGLGWRRAQSGFKSGFKSGFPRAVRGFCLMDKRGGSQSNRTRVQVMPWFPDNSSHAKLRGAPWLGLVMQPGFRNRTPLRTSSLGTWVCPWSSRSQPSALLGGACTNRIRRSKSSRSRDSGQSENGSQLPRTHRSREATGRRMSRTPGEQMSPRCQISSADARSSRSRGGSRSWVSARTATRRLLR